MQTAVIINPGAGTSPIASQHASDEEFAATLLQILRGLGLEPQIYYTTLDDPGEGIARELAEQQTELVVAVGGDGTIHAVARGLLGSSSVLGIIPAGTMNNLAHSLGIPQDLQAACALLVQGQTCAIDVGMINQEVFLEVAGIGLEAALYPAAEEFKSPGFFSTLRSVADGLVALLSFHPPEISVTINNERPRTYHAMQITACNSPYYGVHLNIAPGIVMNDGWLDMALYTNFSKLEYLRHAISISRGQRPFTPKIVYRRVKNLRLYADAPIEIHADGRVIGKTPANITIRPGALKVQVPQTPAPGLLPAKPLNKKRLTFLARRKTSHV